MKTYEEIKTAIEKTNPRSAWNKGVKLYALNLIEDAMENAPYYADMPRTVAELEKRLLNGAQDWKQYSEGGCSLIYDGDIATRLCSPSELRKVQYKEGGYKEPNARENWIDVQARALRQAFEMIRENAQ